MLVPASAPSYHPINLVSMSEDKEDYEEVIIENNMGMSDEEDIMQATEDEETTANSKNI